MAAWQRCGRQHGVCICPSLELPVQPPDGVLYRSTIGSAQWGECRRVGGAPVQDAPTAHKHSNLLAHVPEWACTTKGPPRVGIVNPRLNQNTTMPTSRMPTPIHKAGLSSGLFWEEGSAAGRHHAPAGPGGGRLDRLPVGPRPRGFSTAIALNTRGGNGAGVAL